MIKWIKKHKKSVAVFIAVVIMVVIPFLIHVCFKVPSPNIFFAAQWSAGDALVCYVGMLTFCSTTFLSIVALKQSKISSNEELLSENRMNIYITPKEQALIEFYDYVAFELSILLKIEARFIPSVPPTNVVVKFLVIRQEGFERREEIVIKWDKDIMGNVLLKSETKLEFIINIFDTNQRYYSIDPSTLIAHYKRGYLTKEEFLNNASIRLSMSLGVYSGSIVTPIDVFMHLVPIVETIKQMGELRSCMYSIDEARCYMRHALKEKEFETHLNI